MTHCNHNCIMVMVQLNIVHSFSNKIEIWPADVLVKIKQITNPTKELWYYSLHTLYAVSKMYFTHFYPPKNSETMCIFNQSHHERQNGWVGSVCAYRLEGQGFKSLWQMFHLSSVELELNLRVVQINIFKADLVHQDTSLGEKDV
jgi:hypothetical protein